MSQDNNGVGQSTNLFNTTFLQNLLKHSSKLHSNDFNKTEAIFHLHAILYKLFINKFKIILSLMYFLEIFLNNKFNDVIDVKQCNHLCIF